MADVKISGLPASTVPLAGTEVLPVVQGGVTKQVSVNNLTTGKAVSATQYTSTIATGTAPLVVASTTEVANLRAANATSADTANQVKSNATTGVLQVAGPGTGATRVMTTPDANFTAARTDAAQTFTGTQTFSGSLLGTRIQVGTPATINTPAGVDQTLQLTNYSAGAYVTGSPDNFIYKVSGAIGSVAAHSTVFQTRSDVNGGGFAWVSGSTPAPGMIFDANQNLNLITGNLVIGTSGKGIDFSATPNTGTSELLDDYEEGTYSPAFEGDTNPTVTYTTQSGKYTLVGNIVTFSAVISWSAASGGTGNLRVTLPFAASGSQGSFVVGLAGGITTVTLNGACDSGQSRFYFRDTVSNSGGLNVSSLGASGTVLCGGTYFI
jgi:hypothetical protein